MSKKEISRSNSTNPIATGTVRRDKEDFAPAEMEAFEVAAYFGTDMEKGLSKQQVRKARMEYGQNLQAKEYDESMASGIKKQISFVCMPLMIVSLLMCAAFTTGSELYSPLAALLAAVMIVNAGLEKYAAYSLNKSIRKTALRSRVIRDDKRISISSASLVPGDIIELESGTVVPADARLAETNHLCVLETPVTGVKVSTEKDADYLAKNEEGGSYNMVYSGTIVTEGRAIAIVCRTGKDCRLYKESESAEEALPQVYHKTKRGFGIFTLSVAALCFTLVLVGFFMGRPLVDVYMLAVASALCCMQGSLGALMLVGFALGVRKMYKNAAILRRPAAVDALCRVDTVMCDKPVAFPMSELEPKKIYINRSYYDVKQDSREDIKKLMTLALLCSDVRRNGNAGDLGERFFGMPADVSLARACDEIGIDINKFGEEYFRMEAEYDRDGAVKRALYLHNDSNLLILRGKPEEILPLCAGYDAQGTNNRFDEFSRRRMEDAAKEMGDASQHVIAVASSVCECDSLRNTVMAERRLVLNGFIGLYTSLKLDSASAVYKCSAGGIETVMLSEDAYVTAASMAKNAGIIENEKQIMSAEELKFTDRGLYIADSEGYKLYLNLNDSQWHDVLDIRKDMGKTVAVTAHNTDRLSLMKAADASFVPAMDSPETVKYAADVLLYKNGLKTVEAVLRASKMIYKRIVGAARQLAIAGIAVLVCLVYGLLNGGDFPLRLQDIIIAGVCLNPVLALCAALASDHRRLLEDKVDYGGGIRGKVFTVVYGIAVGLGLVVMSLLLDRMGSTGNSRATAMLACFGAFLVLGLLFGAEQQHINRSSAFKSFATPLGALWVLLVLLASAALPVMEIFAYTLPSYKETLSAVVLPLGVFSLFQLVLMTEELVGIFKTARRKENRL